MGKSSKTPDAPNYSGIAQQQAQQSKQAWSDQLQANRPNQTNQFGSSSWSQDPTTGAWTQATQLNQPQQDIFNSQQANQQQVANMTGSALGGYDTSQVDLSGAPAMGQVGGFNQQATDLYNQLAQPGLDRQNDAARARAAAMGIPEFGSRAGTTMNQQIADATSRSGMMGAQAGINQGNTEFGQQNQLHSQGVSDILNQKQANEQQLSGLMGLGQQMGTPQFSQFNQAGAYQTPDLMSAADKGYSANLDKTNAKNADNANTMKTVGTVATIAAMAF
jgi:hypothetical protein